MGDWLQVFEVGPVFAVCVGVVLPVVELFLQVGDGRREFRWLERRDWLEKKVRCFGFWLDQAEGFCCGVDDFLLGDL
ncbi:hypothetical protein D3C74_362100 [compost metagenome]